ncbi:MAG: formate/nitrite transporter family protein [Methanobrevibacter sp.]
MSSLKSPKEVAAAVANTGGAKANASVGDAILLSFLAGAYIAFGGLLAEIANAGMTAAGYPIGLSKFVFGAVFPVGLIMVIICGSDLFTGNCLYMTMGALSGKNSWGGLGKNWVISWIFNLVGGLFVAYVLAYCTGIMSADPFKAGAVTVATTKALGGAKFMAAGKATASLTWTQAFLRGIGCNWLVCLACWLAVASDDVISKIFGIWFPIMAFVTIGFEHSVANMFFIPLGIFCGAKITWADMFVNNLIPVTIGNIVGGALFVACIYYLVYIRE